MPLTHGSAAVCIFGVDLIFTLKNQSVRENSKNFSRKAKSR
jgi:hypothetical protein